MNDRDRKAFEAWAGNPPVELDGKAGDEITFWCWQAWQAAIKQEREQSCKLADALQELLNDTQHAKHESCTDGGYCPVRDAREALEGFRARSEG